MSAQSIDIYSCRIHKKSGRVEEQNPVNGEQALSVILVGTRNGDIVEFSFQLDGARGSVEQLERVGGRGEEGRGL